MQPTPPLPVTQFQGGITCITRLSVFLLHWHRQIVIKYLPITNLKTIARRTTVYAVLQTSYITFVLIHLIFNVFPIGSVWFRGLANFIWSISHYQSPNPYNIICLCNSRLIRMLFTFRKSGTCFHAKTLWLWYPSHSYKFSLYCFPMCLSTIGWHSPFFEILYPPYKFGFVHT